MQRVKGISLLSKSAETYFRLFAKLKGFIPTANLSSVLTDFESATVNPFDQHYPATAQLGCYGRPM